MREAGIMSSDSDSQSQVVSGPTPWSLDNEGLQDLITDKLVTDLLFALLGNQITLQFKIKKYSEYESGFFRNLWELDTEQWHKYSVSSFFEDKPWDFEVSNAYLSQNYMCSILARLLRTW